MSGPLFIDVDGVLADFSRKFHEEAARLGIVAPPYTTYTIPSWDHTWFTSEESDAIWSVIRTSPWWWFGLRPLTDSWRRVDDLTTRRQVYFVTSRPESNPCVLTQTTLWLKSWGIEAPSVICADRKGELAALLGASWMIDDKPEHAYATLQRSPKTTVCLMARPYNKGEWEAVKAYGGMVVDSVEEFLEEVGRDGSYT